jgi:hypothetical protein
MKSLQLKTLAVTIIAAAGLSALTVPAARAASPLNSGNFDVSITLTPSCTVSTPATINLTYTSFQPTDATGSSNFDVKCTNTLTYTPSVFGAATTDDAVNLDYTLGLTAPVGGGTGTGVAQTYSVDATIPYGQSGDCNSLTTCDNSLATNKAHYVTITY